MFDRKINVSAVLIIAWGILQVLCLAFRPYIPIDETRYVSVAWEMWIRNDFLVPYLNGVSYSHKPPMLSWLIHAGWFLFGVNEWWPRLVSPLFSLGSLFMIRRIACLLWPDNKEAQFNVPLILFSTLLWTIFNTVLMFDMIMTFFILVALFGMLKVHKEKKQGYWILSSVAIGLGALTKGPVVLLPILSVGLLAPFWTDNREVNWVRWYVGLILSAVGGILIGLSWVAAIVAHSGLDYVKDILFSQTFNRVVSSFDHARPFWFYLVMIPLVWFPWSLYPPLWKKLKGIKEYTTDPGVRFVLTWLCVPLILFSLISGKQIQYIMPLFPAFALLTGYLLSLDSSSSRRALWPACIVLCCFGMIFIVSLHFIPASFIGLPFRGPEHIPPLMLPFSGLFMLVAGICLFKTKLTNRRQEILLMSLISVGLVYITLFGILRTIRPAFDVTRFSHFISDQRKEGNDVVVNSRRYFGQFNFLGRLTSPVLRKKDAELEAWVSANPNGFVMEYLKKYPSNYTEAALIVPYINQYIAAWPAKDYLNMKARMNQPL
ncbi:MAG: glycosyltransferase family 39 protein [Candidatus Omnitrophica bacterium]|nr:glycosyltransferase family 39 protein [Candidatus Omnitrophota bacterium]